MNLLMAITEKGAARDGDGDSVGGAVDLRRGGKEVMSLIGKEGLSSCDEGDYDRFPPQHRLQLHQKWHSNSSSCAR